MEQRRQAMDAPTISEWSTISLHANVRLILEIWRYVNKQDMKVEDTAQKHTSICRWPGNTNDHAINRHDSEQK